MASTQVESAGPPGVGRVHLAAAAMLALAAALLILATPAAAEGEVLIERPTPFELPKTYAEPNAFVADAAPGSNGTAHYLVATRFSWYYIWANTTTGATIESLNLTDLGMVAMDFLQTYTDLSWRMTFIDAQAGRVFIVRASANAVVDVIMFAEGDTEHAVAHKLLLPAPEYGSMANLNALTIARNGSDPWRPSIIWARYVTSSNASQASTEIGQIPIDLGALAVGRAEVLTLVGNFSLHSYASYSGSGPIYDHFRLYANNQPLAAAVGSSSGLWITMAGYEYTCSRYVSGRCTAYSYNWTLASLSMTYGYIALEKSPLPVPYYTHVRAVSTPSPDGYVAIALIESDGFGQALIHRVASLQQVPPGLSTQALPVSIVTSADLYSDGSRAHLVVVALQNGTQWPESLVYHWEDYLSTDSLGGELVGRIERPLERMRVAAASSSGLLLVGGTQNQWAKAQGNLDGARMMNTSYAQAWPTVVSVASNSVALRGISNWQPLVPASITSIALATLADGSRVGAVIAVENGTGTVRLLAASGSPLRFVLHPPMLDLHLEAISVQAVSLGDRALIAVQVVRPFMWQWVTGYYSESHLWFTADSQGTSSTTRMAYPDVPPSYGYSYGSSWALSESGGRGLLHTGYGLYILNPATGTSQYRISTAYQYYGEPANVSKFIGTNETIAPPSPLTDYSYCGSYSYGYCFHSISWWMDGQDLYGAYVVSNYSLTYQYYYCNCLFKVRVVHWRPNDTVSWADVSLATGASNDTLYFPPYADLAIVANGDTTTLIVSARQPNLWERVFRVNYSRATETFGAPQLLREAPAAPYTYLRDHVGTSADFAAVVKSMETGNPYSYPYPIPMREAFAANATSTRTLRFEAVTVYCYWNYWYYYPYDWPYYYNQLGCPRWIPTSWSGELAVLVVEFGKARFFSVNHPPSAPRLIEPADGSALTTRAVHFRVSPAVDIDQDALTYRFEVFDRFGNLVARVERAAPDLDYELPDGQYHWTCSVSDGVLRVACLGNFSLTLDATPPLVSAGGPYSVHPGDGVHLTGEASYDPAGIVSYAWRVGEGAGALTFTGPTVDLGWPELVALYHGGSTFPVTLTVVDGSGNPAVGSTFVILIDDPVAINIVFLTPNPAEGDSVRIGADISWGRLSWTWDGAGSSITDLTILWKFPFGQGAEGLLTSFEALDSGTFAVTVSVAHIQGGRGSATANISIENVAPTAFGEGPSQLGEGETAAFRVTANDPSPIDAASLAIEWATEGGVEVIGPGFNVTVRATAHGPAWVRAVVSDKDGGRAFVEFELRVAQAADPATGLWVASVGKDWAELRWIPTIEADFAGYEVTIYDASGAKMRVQSLTGLARAASREIIVGLEAATWYRFDLVVVATEGVRSLPTTANATTAPPDAPTTPPPGTTPPGGEEPAPIPSAQNPGTAMAVDTASAGASILWAVIALFAGAGGFLYVTRVQRRRQE